MPVDLALYLAAGVGAVGFRARGKADAALVPAGRGLVWGAVLDPHTARVRTAVALPTNPWRMLMLLELLGVRRPADLRWVDHETWRTSPVNPFVEGR